MAKTVTITWNQSVINKVIKDNADLAVGKAAGRTRDRAKTILTQAGRIDKGTLRNSLYSKRLTSTPDGTWWEVGSEQPYARFQHDGVEGPVLPRRAKVLRFKPKGSNQFVFAKSTAGFKGVPYLEDARAMLTMADYQ